MDEYRIPFNRVTLGENVLRYIEDAFKLGHICGNGPFTQKCTDLLEELLGVYRVLMTTSCTHALEMCALLLDIRPGDELIVPSFAFVTTVGAFALRGAKPVFVDIRPDTLNLDERLVRECISSRTKAIIALHYAGVACEMDELNSISQERGVPIIEDNAHGLFGAYKGRYLGTFGRLATLSFHETKNFTSGEGGALIINDPELEERAKIIHAMGTDRHLFLDGTVEKYTWVDYGSSFMPSDILAAILYAQLKQKQEIQKQRKKIWNRYHYELADWARVMGVKTPIVPSHCEPSYHLYYLILPSFKARNYFISFLRRRGILSVFHYSPLHLSSMGQRLRGQSINCPVTTDVSNRLVRLPFFNSMSDMEQDQVISAIMEFDCQSN